MLPLLQRQRRRLLEVLLEKRLQFERKASKTDDEKAEYSSCIDEMSKISAIIDRIQKDGRVSLRVHIHCLEKFMAALKLQKAKLFTELIPFQLDYLDLLAEELKG